MGSAILWMAAGAPLFAEEKQKATPPAAGISRIVVLGDSITAGYGLSKEQAYPALLQTKLKETGHPATVANAGVSGDTTAGGLRRVAWALGPGADVLIIALGGNDGLRGLSPDQTAANLAGIITKAREKNPAIRVILAGMQMPSNMGAEYTEAFKNLYPRVAKENNAILLPFLLEGVGGDPQFNQDDQIHPNEAGQKRIAETVWDALQPLLAAKPE